MFPKELLKFKRLSLPLSSLKAFKSWKAMYFDFVKYHVLFFSVIRLAYLLQRNLKLRLMMAITRYRVNCMLFRLNPNSPTILTLKSKGVITL